MIDAAFNDLFAEATWPIKPACDLVGKSRATLYRRPHGPMHEPHARYVVAWMVAPTETAALATSFIAVAIAEQDIDRDTLSIHADRGTSMTSKPVAQLLVDLGVARTHSWPHVSNANPYSEANFKALSYCPAFPGRFGSIRDDRASCDEFFDDYTACCTNPAWVP